MVSNNHRLTQLRAAKDVIGDLEEELGGQGETAGRQMRTDLQSAGNNISQSGFDRYLEKAMGRAAGIAIASDLDEIADRATRVMDADPSDDLEDPHLVERQTDDKGRVTLGAEFANQEVAVRIIDAKPVEEAE